MKQKKGNLQYLIVAIFTGAVAVTTKFSDILLNLRENNKIKINQRILIEIMISRNIQK